MNVFRITLTKWSTKFSASGYPARWNPKGTFVIYTASTRALACLENVVHRTGEGLTKQFKTMVITIPSKVKIKTVQEKKLIEDWRSYESYSYCQTIGLDWIIKEKFAVLKVPSAIIPNEFNYLINTRHKDFKYIKLKRTEPFNFDSRIKQIH